MTKIGMRANPGTALLAGSVGVWLLLIATGGAVLLNYQHTAGAQGKAAGFWPAGVPILRSPGRATLVMFAHPRCPCTRASIEELARLMARRPGRVEASVLFYKPRGLDTNWAQTDLWHSAATIPGVHVQIDEDGQAAHRFGSKTSGHTLLYAEDGALLFRGGITASRGHAGDNVGRTKIMALLDERHVQEPSTPVFGCPLRDPESCNGGNGPCPKALTPNRI